MNIPDDEVPDIVWGATAIARVINRSPRQVFNLLEKGHLPAKRVGNRWCASRKRLLAALIGEDASTSKSNLEWARSSRPP
jgi:hypothetical protein